MTGACGLLCLFVNSLSRHDWVYRWRTILEAVGLEPTPEMLSREAYLNELAGKQYNLIQNNFSNTSTLREHVTKVNTPPSPTLPLGSGRGQDNGFLP